MRNIGEKAILFCLILFSTFYFACAHDIASLKVEKSLPAEKLARYNDSFDSLRDDIWGKIGSIPNLSQRANFKWADVSIENGRLKIETKTGCFSRGGISSKFYFRGDFDVQVDCHVDFLKDINTMDQSIWFKAYFQTVGIEDNKSESTGFAIFELGMDPAFIFCDTRSKGILNKLYSRRIGNFFKGALRIVRIGDQITLLYTTKIEGEWQKACSLSRSANDARIDIAASNHVDSTFSIDAKLPFIVRFDNFKVNAAQEIIEDEI